MTDGRRPTPEFLALQAAVSGRYSIERELGRGGMGIVFLAQDPALERAVAIKMLAPALTQLPDVRARFLREARTVAALSHPNIVPIHAVEERDDLLYFVMTFVEGESLRARVERTGPMPSAEVAGLVRDVAWALGYAHGRGVIHRDVKPDNILLERATGRVLLTDFGIAHRSTEETLSGENELVGTLQYMSPEQAGGAALDGRSDLYALGLTGLFALSGRAPIQKGPMLAVLAQVLNGEPIAVDSLLPGAPEGLRRALADCVAREVTDRPASGEALASTLDAQVARKITAPLLRSAVSGVRSDALVVLATTAASLPLWTAPSEILGISEIMILPFALPLIALLSGLFSTVERLTAVVREGFTFEQLRAAVREARGSRAEEAGVLGAYRISAEREFLSPKLHRGSQITLTALGALAIVSGISSIIGGENIPFSLLGMGGGLFMINFVRTVARAEKRPILEAQTEAQGISSALDAAQLLTTRVGHGLFRWVERHVSRRRQAVVAAPLPSGEHTMLARVDEALRLLPEDARARLGDVIALASQLETRAATLRRRVAVTELALRGLPADSGHRAAFDSAAAHLQGRLGQIVEALNSIRLELLRFGAGLATDVSITAAIADARKLGDEIDIELSAIDEVRRIL